MMRILVVSALIVFSVPPQPLAGGLLEFARQAGVELFLPTELLECRWSAPLEGRYEPGDALRLLLRDSGCEGEIRDGVIRLECDTPPPDCRAMVS